MKGIGASPTPSREWKRFSEPVQNIGLIVMISFYCSQAFDSVNEQQRGPLSGPLSGSLNWDGGREGTRYFQDVNVLIMIFCNNKS